MSRSVRNALLFVGLVALAWVLLVLAWRVARWLLIATVWLIALAVTGAILLSQVVTQRFPPWIARLRADHGRGRAQRHQLELACGPATLTPGRCRS
jgi:hypothetical protein